MIVVKIPSALHCSWYYPRNGKFDLDSSENTFIKTGGTTRSRYVNSWDKIYIYATITILAIYIKF